MPRKQYQDMSKRESGSLILSDEAFVLDVNTPNKSFIFNLPNGIAKNFMFFVKVNGQPVGTTFRSYLYQTDPTGLHPPNMGLNSAMWITGFGDNTLPTGVARWFISFDKSDYTASGWDSPGGGGSTPSNMWANVQNDPYSIYFQLDGDGTHTMTIDKISLMYDIERVSH